MYIHVNQIDLGSREYLQIVFVYHEDLWMIAVEAVLVVVKLQVVANIDNVTVIFT